MKILIHKFLSGLFPALLFICSGCATVVINIGGTVNIIPVSKINRDGVMQSTNTPSQSNPAETDTPIRLY